MKRVNEEKNGYKTISSTVDYQTPYSTVYKDIIIFPDGKEKEYWIAERAPFSIIIPLFPDNSTILVGQYRIPVDYYSWEFPMGSVEGAQPLENAKQELQEETGYIAKKWEHIGNYFWGPGTTTTKVSVFIARDLKEGTPHPEETEHLTVKRLTIPEIEHMIQSGDILDGPTITAYHYLEMYLKNTH